MTKEESGGSAKADAEAVKAARDHPDAVWLAAELKRKIDSEEAKDADFLEALVGNLRR